MPTSRQSLSPIGQYGFDVLEAAPRPIVGFARDYPAGMKAELHCHARAQLLYAVSGVMRIRTPTAAYIVPPTMALFLPACQMHSICMDGVVRMRALILRDDAAERATRGTAVVAVSSLLREVIVAACSEPLTWDVGGRGYHLAELALDEISRASVLPLGVPIPTDIRLVRALERLRERISDPITLEQLASSANASSRTLARLIRAETGMSFRQWRQQARMAEAMAALSSGSSLARVASMVGYRGQAAFGAAFLSAFAMTPGQARRLSRQ